MRSVVRTCVVAAIGVGILLAAPQESFAQG